jgi:AbrB family looped-hinge helix DNA binding protein
MATQTKTIGSRGRITIPSEFRQSLGLQPGDSVEFIIEGRGAVLRRVEHNNATEEIQLALPAEQRALARGK